MNDNRHYRHDVVGGAVLGICYGLAASEGLKKLKSDLIRTDETPF